MTTTDMHLDAGRFDPTAGLAARRVQLPEVTLSVLEAGVGGVAAQPVLLQVWLLLGGRDPQVEGGAGPPRRCRRPSPPSSKVFLHGHQTATS